MTQEEKQLLLKDFCARLPYRVHAFFDSGLKSDKDWIVEELDELHLYWLEEEDLIKPYLRPMSSMTEKEKEEYDKWHEELEEGRIKDWKYANYIDWLNAHHFDYRGLIEKSLALEAPEGMYTQ